MLCKDVYLADCEICGQKKVLCGQKMKDASAELAEAS